MACYVLGRIISNLAGALKPQGGLLAPADKKEADMQAVAEAVRQAETMTFEDCKNVLTISESWSQDLRKDLRCADAKAEAAVHAGAKYIAHVLYGRRRQNRKIRRWLKERLALAAGGFCEAMGINIECRCDYCTTMYWR